MRLRDLSILGMMAGGALLVYGLVFDIVSSGDEKTQARKNLLVIALLAVIVVLGHFYGLVVYGICMLTFVAGCYLYPLLKTAFQSDNRFRVRLSDGRIGTVDKADFDPETMTRL